MSGNLKTVIPFCLVILGAIPARSINQCPKLFNPLAEATYDSSKSAIDTLGAKRELGSLETSLIYFKNMSNIRQNLKHAEQSGVRLRQIILTEEQIERFVSQVERMVSVLKASDQSGFDWMDIRLESLRIGQDYADAAARLSKNFGDERLARAADIMSKATRRKESRMQPLTPEVIKSLSASETDEQTRLVIIEKGNLISASQALVGDLRLVKLAGSTSIFRAVERGAKIQQIRELDLVGRLRKFYSSLRLTVEAANSLGVLNGATKREFEIAYRSVADVNDTVLTYLNYDLYKYDRDALRALLM